MDYLGSNLGGSGYFVKYCPHCNEKIYLMEGDEMNEFMRAAYVPNTLELIKHYFKQRLSLPKIHIEWQNARVLEIERLNEKIELSNMKTLIKKDPKLFSRSFFDEKYFLKGGIAKLEEMVKENVGPSEIGQFFGFSKQRASDILQSYKFGKIAI